MHAFENYGCHFIDEIDFDQRLLVGQNINTIYTMTYIVFEKL
jgi:hypothetical protein